MATVRKRRSNIWTLFDKVDKNEGMCRLCRKTYKTSGNTTNMKEHLRRKHPRHYLDIFPGDAAKVKPEKKTAPARKPMPSFDSSFLESFVCTEIEPYSLHEGDYTHIRSFGQQEREVQNDLPDLKGPHWKMINGDCDELRRALHYFVIHDCLPFDTVEGEGFKHFASVWQPQFKIPSRRTFLRNIETLAQTLSDMILDEMAVVEHITLTMDIWTETAPVNRPVRHYICLTAHYLYNYKTTSRAIGIREMVLGYTKESIEAILDDILGRWNIIKEKVAAFMTDENDVLVDAVRSYFSPQTHLYSFSHLLNIAVIKAFNESHQFNDVVKQIKAIVAFCRENGEIMEQLASAQMKNGTSSADVLVLIQDNELRWMSTVLMLQRFTVLYKHVACLAVDVDRFPVVINNRQLEALKECLMLFQPIEEVMKEICLEKQVSISKIIPLIRCLENSLENVNVASELAEDLKSRLVEHVKKQFGEIEISRLHSCATIMDPRFKTLHLTTATGAAQALVNIIEELNHAERQEAERKGDETIHEILPDSKQAALWDHHESLMTKTNVPVSISVSGGDQNNVPLSLQQYLNSGIICRTDDPLTYWQSYSFVYPDIGKLALKYLSILGATAPSDCFAGYMSKLVTKTKNRLHPKQLENIIMLNSLSLDDWDKVHKVPLV